MTNGLNIKRDINADELKVWLLGKESLKTEAQLLHDEVMEGRAFANSLRDIQNIVKNRLYEYEERLARMEKIAENLRLTIANLQEYPLRKIAERFEHAE